MFLLMQHLLFLMELQNYDILALLEKSDMKEVLILYFIYVKFRV